MMILESRIEEHLRIAGRGEKGENKEGKGK